MSSRRVVIVGAGIGGLVAAAELARRGVEVTVLERAGAVGGKLRTERVAGRDVDVGPTVMTMRWVFDALFRDAGRRLDDHLTLRPLSVLARHAWQGGSRLDLFSDVERTAAAIERFAGPAEAAGYRELARRSERIFELVQGPFMSAQRPTFASMMAHAGRVGPRAMVEIDAHKSMWAALGACFSDARLQQLFGRYATYAGSSPFEAPGTLNVIAHVERVGVWSVEGGMRSVAEAVAGLARAGGATIRCGAHVREIQVAFRAATGVVLEGGELLEADAVVFAGDASALGERLLGKGAARAATPPKKRSLSAITMAAVGSVRGFALHRHNVFFSRDYVREWGELGRGRVPSDPTIYLCAQDRERDGPAVVDERMFFIVNAPAMTEGADSWNLQRAQNVIESTLAKHGISLTHAAPPVLATPVDFARRFPGSQGAIYGAATHGMAATFARPGARSAIRGLYLAGGSVHPGAGVPMAAISGRLSATALLEDLPSIGRSRTVATHGGISTL
jgi:1-hydroxycarotenoid 3,4-desaturase